MWLGKQPCIPPSDDGGGGPPPAPPVRLSMVAAVIPDRADGGGGGPMDGGVERLAMDTLRPVRPVIPAGLRPAIHPAAPPPPAPPFVVGIPPPGVRLCGAAGPMEARPLM